MMMVTTVTTITISITTKEEDVERARTILYRYYGDAYPYRQPAGCAFEGGRADG
jgi:hypothetical protein